MAGAFKTDASELSGLLGVFANVGQSGIKESQEAFGQFAQQVKLGMSGAEEATQFFKDLGVSAQEFSTLDITSQFWKFHEALMKIESPMQRYNLLSQFGGTDTSKLIVNLLNHKTSALKDMAKGYQQSGEQIWAAQNATKANKEALAEYERVWVQLAVSLAPAIEMFSNLAKQILPQLGDEMNKMSESGSRSWLVETVELAGKVYDRFVIVKDVIGAIVAQISDAVVEIGEFVGLIDKAKAGQLHEGLNKMVEQGRNSWQGPWDRGTGQRNVDFTNQWEQARNARMFRDEWAARRKKEQDEVRGPGLQQPTPVTVTLDQKPMIESLKRFSEIALRDSKEANTSITNALQNAIGKTPDRARQQIDLQKQTNTILTNIDRMLQFENNKRFFTI